MTDGSVLALDIGGTKLAAGLVDEAGRVRSFLTMRTPAAHDPGPVLDALFALGRKAVVDAGADWSEVAAVGIGCGGPLDAERGVVLAPPHLPGWRDVPVTELAEWAFDRPAALDNDGTAAAAAEHRHGAGVGTRQMVYLTLSTGVGGGAVLDGRIYRGASGNGTELGHLVVDRHGRACRGCGGRGCLEAYVSGTSIAERASADLDPASSLVGVDPLTAADVAAHAAAGDPLAARVWRHTVEALGAGLVSIVNMFEPELIVLGGGVTRAGDALIGPARAAVRSAAMTPGGRAVRVERAKLGDRVGVVGAAVVAQRFLAARGAAPEGTPRPGRPGRGPAARTVHSGRSAHRGVRGRRAAVHVRQRGQRGRRATSGGRAGRPVPAHPPPTARAGPDRGPVGADLHRERLLLR
jgi:glucokinase